MTELEKYYREKARLPKGMFPKLDKDDERVMRFMEGYAKEVVKKLNIDDVSNNEVTACVHPLDQLRIIGGNISCLSCKGYWKRTS